MIYFIQREPCGLVKIGCSRRPLQRLQGLQAAHPERLRLFRLLRGARDEERYVHDLFAAHRVRGEWFCFDSSMLDETGLDDVPVPDGGLFAGQGDALAFSDPVPVDPHEWRPPGIDRLA